jgi:serine/threonine protein kinase
MHRQASPESLANFWNPRYPGLIPEHLVIAEELKSNVIQLEGRDLVAVELGHILALSPLMERPAPATIKKIEHEFSLKDKLDPAWAIRPTALTQQQSRAMLVFEDPDGEPLDRHVRRPMELNQFLRCAIALAAALGQVHRHGLVHKDIKPSNVLVNAALDQAWLTGFGIAPRLPRERQRAEPPEFISGTLAYMAPEQAPGTDQCCKRGS